MISYNKALEIIAKQAAPLAPMRLPLSEALGKVAAKTVRSPIAVPPFRNSMMDGYAVKAAEATAPLPLLENAIAAGDKPTKHQMGHATEITTGAMVPEGADAIVPVEDVTLHDGKVHFESAVKEEQFVRHAGSDFNTGDVLLTTCERIHSGHVMALAAAGVHEVAVRCAPEVHLLTTGNEVMSASGQSLPRGKIYDANAPFILSKLAEDGVAAKHHGHITDSEADFHAALDDIPAGSVILTTGAVSKGKWDFIPEALLVRGAKIHFHRVAVRPAKPILFATLPCGSFFLGLPGNPISAAVGLRFFLSPLLSGLLGAAPEVPSHARLAEGFTKQTEFRQFLKASVTQAQDGTLEVAIAEGQESYKTLPLTTSNAWVMADENVKQWQAGTLVPFYSFSSGGFTLTAQDREESWQAA